MRFTATPRHAAAALLLAAIAAALHGPRITGGLWRASSLDQYTNIAFNLLHHGTFHNADDLPAKRAAGTLSPYARREPGYPWYLTAILAPFEDSRALSRTCLVDSACDTARPTRQRVQFVTAVVSTATAVAAGAAVHAWTASGVLALGGALFCLLLQPAGAQGVLAGAFLLGHAALAAATWRRPRIRTGLLSGLALGLLALTKAAFQYWLAGIAVFWLAAAWYDPARRRSTFPAFAVLCITAWVIAVPWMARNAATIGQFGISGRGGEILAIRAEYGRMTWSELRGAFAYYLPIENRELRRHALRWPEPPTFGYTRFDRSNPKGFYRRSKNLAGDVAARADDLVPGWRFESLAVQDEALGRAAINQFANDVPKQVGLTAVFTLRGSRIQEPMRAIVAPMTAVWGDTIGALSSDLIRTARSAGVLCLPALGLLAATAWRRRDAALGFLILPALQGIALHAVATHFIPRYAGPFAPIAAVMIMLLLHMIMRSLRKSVLPRNHLAKPGMDLTVGAPS